MTRASIVVPVVAAFLLADAAAGQSAGRVDASEQRIQVEEPAQQQFVSRRNENVTLTLTGRLHRMLLHVDDGANSDFFYTDSEQGPTMLRVDATAAISDAVSIGATIETGIRHNRPFLVSQDMLDGGTSVNVRLAEGYVESSRLGKLSFGRGFASGWLAPEIDLSGTQFANLLPVGMLAPGMKFVDDSTDSLSAVQVLTHFVDAERLLIVDRFRYDSPSLGPGLRISGSIANDGRWDSALRARPQLGDSWSLVAGGSFQKKPFLGIEQRIDGAVSVRHEPSGVNLTVGTSRDDLVGDRNATTYLVKGGWLADLFTIGNTAFTIDYYQANDLRLVGDEGRSFGLFAVQKLGGYGVDVYLGYRRYEVTRSDLDLRPLDVTAVGLAFNF